MMRTPPTGRMAAMMAVMAAGLAMAVDPDIQPPRPRERKPDEPRRSPDPAGDHYGPPVPRADPERDAAIAKIRDDRAAKKAANWAKRQPKGTP